MVERERSRREGVVRGWGMIGRVYNDRNKADTGYMMGLARIFEKA